LTSCGFVPARVVAVTNPPSKKILGAAALDGCFLDVRCLSCVVASS